MPSTRLIEDKPTQVLQSLDFNPVPPRFPVNDHAKEIVEKSSGSSTDILTTVTNLFNRAQIEESTEEAGGKYKWLNTLLGVIAFCLIGYLMKVMRPKGPAASTHSRGGGGMFGSNKSKGGGGGLFGSKGRSGGGGGLFSGKKRR